jgi:hypothetical protein
MSEDKNKLKKLTEIDRDDPAVFTRPRWVQAVRLFGCTILLMLNFCLTMSIIDRHSHGFQIILLQELVTILFVLFLDVIILLPMAFEVDMAKITDEGLVLKTTFRKKLIPWNEITSFKAPVYLKLAILRTRGCFYLINKRQLKRYDQLAGTISSKAASQETKT